MTNNAHQETVALRLADLQRENELLVVELYRAQEELERNYSRERASAKKQLNPASADASAADELLDIHAENQRLQALVDVQRNVHRLESSGALNARIGDILIDGVDAPRAFLSMPGKLAKVWRQSRRQTPSAALGKDFGKVVAAYREGGFDTVAKLFTGLSASASMQANAYTVLARQIAKEDRASAAEAARRAYGADPKAFRLKWLAFRLHEAGAVVEAEAMLDVLPAEIQFSESEARQASRLRGEANRARQNEAKRKTAFAERRAAAERRVNDLVAERDRQSRIAAECAREVDKLKQSKAALEKDKSALAAQCEAQSRLVEQRGRELDALKHDHARVTKQGSRLESELLAERAAAARKESECQSLLVNLHQVQEALEQALGEREDLQLAQTRLQEALRNAEAQSQEIATLKQTVARLEQDQQVLAERHHAQSQIAEERGRGLEALKQVKLLLEQEKQALVIKREVQAEIAAERVKELEALKQANAQLEHDRQASTIARDAQGKVAEERARQIEVLKQAKTKLEQEKQALTAAQETQSKAAEERGRQLEVLKQANIKLEQEKTSLEKQKQSVRGAGNKGDADIDDLMLDLDLFFGGKAIVYVDVGAYVGDVFLKIKRSTKKFRIHEAHLFEPNPGSYAQLIKKTAASDGPILHTYNLAVSAATDSQRFIPARSMTKALSTELQSAVASDDVFDARCVTLDSHASIFTDGKINLLKIDVEGKEMDVLSSARQLLATQSVDILYIEVGFNRARGQQTYFAEVDQFLQDHGYRVLRIYEQKEEWMRDSPLLRRANIAYMSEKFANAHPLKLMQELQELKNRLSELSVDAVKS